MVWYVGAFGRYYRLVRVRKQTKQGSGLCFRPSPRSRSVSSLTLRDLCFGFHSRITCPAASYHPRKCQSKPSPRVGRDAVPRSGKPEAEPSGSERVQSPAHPDPVVSPATISIAFTSASGPLDSNFPHIIFSLALPFPPSPDWLPPRQITRLALSGTRKFKKKVKKWPKNQRFIQPDRSASKTVSHPHRRPMKMKKNLN